MAKRKEAQNVGPENSDGTVVAYLDGRPVEIGHPLSEITPDHSADGVTAEGAAVAVERLAAAMGSVSMTIEVMAKGIQEFFHSLELAMAIHLVRIFDPELVHRYRHTKKKRTRKKYEKRILAWFREVFW